MPKPNLLALPVPVRRRETRTFTDKLQPGLEVTFTCQGPGAVERARFAQLGDEYEKRYVTGDKNATPPYGPSDLPLPDKTPLTVNSGLAEVFALAEVIQCPEDEAERFSNPEIGLLSVRAPNAYRELRGWLLGLYNDPYEVPEQRDPEGNGSGLSPTT